MIQTFNDRLYFDLLWYTYMKRYMINVLFVGMILNCVIVLKFFNNPYFACSLAFRFTTSELQLNILLYVLAFRYTHTKTNCTCVHIFIVTWKREYPWRPCDEGREHMIYCIVIYFSEQARILHNYNYIHTKQVTWVYTNLRICFKT